MLVEHAESGGVIKGITQVSVNPSGTHFILSNKNSGTALLYDRNGNQIAVIAPEMALTDSFIANRYPGFPRIDLQRIAEWTDRDSPVSDSIKRQWLRHAYFSAAFDSDTTYSILAWIDNIEPPPASSFVRFPALLRFGYPNRLLHVQPIRIALEEGVAAAFGNDIIHDPAGGGYYTDCHNDSMDRVIAAIDPMGTTRFVTGAQPREHRENRALKYNLYSTHLASLGNRIAYTISTEPFLYLCDSSSPETIAIPLNTPCDNSAFFSAMAKEPSLAGMQNNLSRISLGVSGVGRIADDSLIVIWSCSNGKTGSERITTWNYCYVRPSNRTVSRSVIITPPGKCTIRYIHPDTEHGQLMIFCLCDDERWRVFHEPLH